MNNPCTGGRPWPPHPCAPFSLDCTRTFIHPALDDPARATNISRSTKLMLFCAAGIGRSSGRECDDRTDDTRRCHPPETSPVMPVSFETSEFNFNESRISTPAKGTCALSLHARSAGGLATQACANRLPTDCLVWSDSPISLSVASQRLRPASHAEQNRPISLGDSTSLAATIPVSRQSLQLPSDPDSLSLLSVGILCLLLSPPRRTVTAQFRSERDPAAQPH